MITGEWMTTDDGRRLRTVCNDGVPLVLPGAWLQEVAHRSTSPRTPQIYATYLVVFYRWLTATGLSLEELTVADLRRFRADLDAQDVSGDPLFQKTNVGDSTRRQVMECALRFLDWCAGPTDSEPLVARSSTRRRNKPKGFLWGIAGTELTRNKRLLVSGSKQTLPEYLTLEDVRRIRAWVNRHWGKAPDLRVRNRAIIELLLDSGIRKGELLAIRVTDIDMEQGLVRVPLLKDEYEKAWQTGKADALQKTGSRLVSIGPSAVQWINQYITLYRPREAMQHGHKRVFCLHRPTDRGRPLTGEALRHLFDAMNRPASEGGCGLQTHIHPHIFRHTFATWAREDGVDLRTIQTQLGHRDPDTTAIYDHVAPTARKRELDEWRGLHPERYREDALD